MLGRLCISFHQLRSRSSDKVHKKALHIRKPGRNLFHEIVFTSFLVRVSTKQSTYICSLIHQCFVRPECAASHQIRPYTSYLEVIVINVPCTGNVLFVEEIVSRLFLLHILLRPSLIDSVKGYKEVKGRCDNQVGLIRQTQSSAFQQR